MNTKHPVSQLQELMAKEGKSLPQYVIRPTGFIYMCTVCAAGLEATGSGPNKQTAKYAAAVQLLKKLGFSSSYDLPAEASLNESQSESIQSKLSGNYNAIGLLNEYTAQRKWPYPCYSECGVDKQGEFRINCTLQSYSVEGTASTKKVAKQIAAHNMLLLLENKDLKTEQEEKSLSVTESKHFISDESIIEKFRAASLTSEHIPMKLSVQNQPIPSFISPDEYTKPLVDSTPTVNDMAQVLKNMNIRYTITEIKNSPEVVLVLNITNKGKERSVMGHGATYEKALLDVLRLAVKFLNADQEDFSISQQKVEH